jgi:hypothetical protein
MVLPGAWPAPQLTGPCAQQGQRVARCAWHVPGSCRPVPAQQQLFLAEPASSLAAAAVKYPPWSTETGRMPVRRATVQVGWLVK